MQWILLIIGAIIGFSIENSFLTTFIGALLGLCIGLNIRLSQLNRVQKQQTAGLQTLKKELQNLRSTHPLQVETTASNDHTSTIEAKKAITTPIKPLKNDHPTESPLVSEVIVTPQPILTENQEKAPVIATNRPTKEVNPSITTPLPAQTSQPERTDPSVKQTPSINPKPSVQTKQPPIKKSPSFVNTLYNKARDWLLGGNTILKIGAIILFLGLAFLLRYATEGMTFPIEARYIAVALGGCIMLGLGWYLRKAALHYGLILQGTGIAILYLTSYAAMYLHHLLAPNIVFVFLLIFTALAALLAIFQNALSLAIAATLGGFAAPVLASSGGGNHVALFCYLLVLNAGILSIAWFKAWRPLNLIGFTGTFGMGFAWGIKAYTPAMFWSTEPFLIIFFFLYLAIALLFARQKLYEKEHAPETRQTLLNWSVQQTNYLDATLIFGTPIVGFGLQCTLVQHFTYGTAISALVLGIFYLIQALLFYRRGSKRLTLLMETNLTLGVIFATLAIPLAFDAKWTSASWVAEAAGIFWVSLKQHRKLGQFFSIFLLLASSLGYLGQLRYGNNTLLEGASLGAILILLSCGFSLYQALKNSDALKLPEKILHPLLAYLGCTFFYLLAPLNLMQQETAICWVIMGFVSLVISHHTKLLTLLKSSFFIQILAIIFFINQLSFRQLGVGFNTNSYLFILCFIFGGLLITNALFVMITNKEDNSAINFLPLRIILLSGLVIIHLSPLFVLPWLWVVCLWAIMACVMSIIAKRFNNALFLYFSLALFITTVINFLINNTLAYSINNLLNINFIALMTLSISAMVMAWQIKYSVILTITRAVLYNISRVLLICGVVGWSIAFIFEINGLVAIEYQNSVFLLSIAISLLIAGIVARYLHWSDLSLAQILLVPIAFIFLNQNFFHPLSHFGWFAWTILIIVHFFNLKYLENLMPRKPLLFCHTTGLWLILIVLSCFLSQLLHKLSIVETTWGWLVWMIIPSLWLVVIVYRQSLPWLINQFNAVYGYVASLPVAIYLFAWYWLANTYSTGTTVFPYIPLLNPLELGLIMALTSCISWLARYQQNLPIHLPTYFIKGILGISLFAMSTAMVFRFAFNWLGVPFHFEDQIHSMTVQASLSILWTVIALALMIRGHQKTHRELWLIGAALITLVVVKLFFVELGNSGSLARIISFTIVGLLLLIVGYFAPLPPKQKDKTIT